MVIVIILIGTILLMGVLCGALALVFYSEEKSYVQHNKVLPPYPGPYDALAPERETVPRCDTAIQALAPPEPAVTQPFALQEAACMKSVWEPKEA